MKKLNNKRAKKVIRKNPTHKEHIQEILDICEFMNSSINRIKKYNFNNFSEGELLRIHSFLETARVQLDFTEGRINYLSQ